MLCKNIIKQAGNSAFMLMYNWIEKYYKKNQLLQLILLQISKAKSLFHASTHGLEIKKLFIKL